MKVKRENNLIFIKTVLITLSFLFISCKEISNNKNKDENLELIINSSKKDGNSDYMYLYLFKEGNTKDSLVCFDIDELRKLYFGKHIENITANLSFEEFTRGVINNKINLECNIFGDCFKKNRKVEDDYKSIGFKRFKEKYTYKTISDNKIYLSTFNLKGDDILNVIYIFYLNGYFTTWADYEGFYISMNEIIINREDESLAIEYFKGT